MAIEMKKDVEEALHAINRKLTTRDALHLLIVPDSIDRIGDYGVNIPEIAINSTISK
jgi:phosphate uptake regulator